METPIGHSASALHLPLAAAGVPEGTRELSYMGGAAAGEPSAAVDVDFDDEPRTELEGGLYWLALELLLRSLATAELAQARSHLP